MHNQIMYISTHAQCMITYALCRGRDVALHYLIVTQVLECETATQRLQSQALAVQVNPYRTLTVSGDLVLV